MFKVDVMAAAGRLLSRSATSEFPSHTYQHLIAWI